MSVAKLKSLVPPPRTPTEVGTLQRWEEIEVELGLRLPRDYREFVFAYGSGLFAGFYRIYNPFSKLEHISLLSSVKRVCGYNRESQRTFPDRFPYTYYPETEGLLPWGNDENGNDYFWLTNGTPTKWKVVQDENRGLGISVQPYSMSAFLVRILQRKTKALAGGYPQQSDYQFEPFK